jgi:diguanylate cyclase (GGDEF)-like protein/PAS domain S-box-containing protein
MRQALQRSESRYRTLVEHSSVGVYLSSRSRLDYVNRALAAMLGYNESDLIGKHYLELLAPEVRDQTIHLHNRLRETGELQREHETVFLHSNGQRVYVRVNLLAIEIDGVRHTTGTILDITLQREAEARLRFHATRDPLTGLVNRMLFNSRLGEAIAGARASGDYRYAVLFLDLDGFKWVNDSLGHGAGDRLLVEIARRIENALIRECVIARYGGDEFTLLPEGPCDEARAVAIARQVIELFEAPFLINGQQVFSGCSVGIVHGRADYESPDQVLRDADTAMYRAKARGKAAYMVFDDAMHREARERFELETEFRQAFERGQFRVDFQPIVDLGSGRIVGAESLVRWRHPQRGLLLPGVFLPMAEETGLIAHLDTWVLGQAVQALLEWSRDGRLDDEFGLNVNVDERQLASSDIVDDLRAMLQAHPLPGARLRLEVTETVFRAGRAPIERRLSALKALGVGLIVDDFGTGYSSLESFAVSPFDALKIDQAFVRDLETNAKHRAIVRTIIGFAADLGLAVTAEGVETEAQRALLLEMGCRRGQGYLFAYPLPREEFEQLLQRKQLLAANG